MKGHQNYREPTPPPNFGPIQDTQGSCFNIRTGPRTTPEPTTYHRGPVREYLESLFCCIFCCPFMVYAITHMPH